MLILKRFNSFELFFNANEDIPLQRAIFRCQKRGIPPYLLVKRIYKRLNKKAHEQLTS